LESKRGRLGSLQKFLHEYRRSKLGLVGVAIIVFFVALALSAPLLTDKNPITDQNLASPYSIPVWARSLPQYSNYPVDSELLLGTALSSQADLQQWHVDATGQATFAQGQNGSVAKFSPNSTLGQKGTVELTQTFAYAWAYPCSFNARITMIPLDKTISSNDLTLDIYLTDPSGKEFHLLGPSVYGDPGDSMEYFASFAQGQPSTLIADPVNPYVNILATGSPVVLNMGACGLPQGIFRPGEMKVAFVLASTVPVSVSLTNAELLVQGRAYGWLGTDELGRDIWSQFVYGARTSLIVGLVAALMSVVIGTIVGLASGFKGGIVDEGLMRFNDFLLVIPFLPFILVILIIMELSHAVAWANTELIIIILLGALSWNGIARVIRSQVITVKERQFVEASRALGGSDLHIIYKHILPNVMGLVYANLALTVPGAILTEAALSFLGFGDPSVVSWGSVVSASAFATTSSLGFAWWWFLPPGLAIAILSTSFVLVGFSLDSILNPKLRRR
jgi:peptide/nickel transport system permease protein